MSADEYVPSDEDIEDTYASTWLNFQNELGRERFRAWLTAHDSRVHRDAAREALKRFRKTELAIIPLDADEDSPIRVRQQALAWRIEMHLLANYPETEDQT